MLVGSANIGRASGAYILQLEYLSVPLICRSGVISTWNSGMGYKERTDMCEHSHCDNLKIFTTHLGLWWLFLIMMACVSGVLCNVKFCLPRTQWNEYSQTHKSIFPLLLLLLWSEYSCSTLSEFQTCNPKVLTTTAICSMNLWNLFILQGGNLVSFDQHCFIYSHLPGPHRHPSTTSVNSTF